MGLTRAPRDSKLAPMFSSPLAPRLSAALRRLFRRAASAAVAVAVLIALCGLSPIAFATMIRCQDAAGRITYQDSTCPNGARGVPIDPYQSSGTRFATRDEINRAMKPEPPPKPPRPERTARGKPKLAGDSSERRFIAPGASSAQVRARIGDPDYTERAPGVRHGKRNSSGQQWVYLPAQGDAQTTTTLTLKDGVVTRVERHVTH